MAFRWKKRLVMDAPRLRIRPDLPWQWRLGFGLLALILVFISLWWAYQAGQQASGPVVTSEQESFQEQNLRLQDENKKLETQVAALESQLKIEKASSAELMKQVDVLNADKIGLQEDLAFFQNLTLSTDKFEKFAIHRAKLMADKMPNEYLFRMLLVRSGERIDEFSGAYQLILTIEQDGKAFTRVLQDENKKQDRFQVKFKYYQRVDAAIHLEKGQQLKQVQVRVFDQGGNKAIATQNVTRS